MNYLIDDILFFAKVVEFNTFKEATNKLELAATTLSRRINALEDKLGKKLLITTRDGFQLTPLGQELAIRFKSYNAQISNELTNLLSNQDNYLYHVNLLLPAVAFVFLSPLHIKRMLESQSNVRLNIHTFSGFELPVDCEKKYDLVITGYLPDTSQFYIKKINSIKSGLYCSPAYVERYGMPQTPDELKSHTNRIACLRPTLQLIKTETGVSELITDNPVISGTVINTLGFLNSGHFIVESSQHARIILQKGNLAVLPEYFVHEYIGYLLKNSAKQNDIVDKIEHELLTVLQHALNQIKPS